MYIFVVATLSRDVPRAVAGFTTLCPRRRHESLERLIRKMPNARGCRMPYCIKDFSNFVFQTLSTFVFRQLLGLALVLNFLVVLLRPFQPTNHERLHGMRLTHVDNLRRSRSNAKPSLHNKRAFREWHRRGHTQLLFPECILPGIPKLSLSLTPRRVMVTAPAKKHRTLLCMFLRK